MPYISQKARVELLHGRSTATSGELNYRITMLVVGYLRMHGFSYQTINDINGALMGALTEFNRRVTAPYEDSKISKNGDVYPSAIAPDPVS